MYVCLGGSAGSKVKKQLAVLRKNKKVVNKHTHTHTHTHPNAHTYTHTHTHIHTRALQTYIPRGPI